MVTAGERRASAKRAQILAGARAVFLRDGFAAASTDALAAAAGVSKRTLYSYYPTKEELFVDLLRSLTVDNAETRVLAFIREVSPRTPAELRATLAALAERFIATIMSADTLALLRAIIADAHRFPPLGTLARATIPEQGLAACRAMLERARANGIPLAGDTEALTRLFIGPLVSHALDGGLLRPAGAALTPDRAALDNLLDLWMRAAIDAAPGVDGVP